MIHLPASLCSGTPDLRRVMTTDAGFAGPLRGWASAATPDPAPTSASTTLKLAQEDPQTEAERHGSATPGGPLKKVAASSALTRPPVCPASLNAPPGKRGPAAVTISGGVQRDQKFAARWGRCVKIVRLWPISARARPSRTWLGSEGPISRVSLSLMKGYRLGEMVAFQHRIRQTNVAAELRP